MANTELTKKLQEQRNSPTVQAFKTKVESFLSQTNAPDWMKYKVRCDLSKKIDMPYYKEAKGKVSCAGLSVIDIADIYIDLLAKYGDKEFTAKLLNQLIKQQSQTFRRLHPIPQKQKNRKILGKRMGKKGVFEHPVPVKHSIDFLVDCINNGDIETAKKYIRYMQTIPQVYLYAEEEKRVNYFGRDSMPDGWDWEKHSPFERYDKAGLDKNIYN